MPGPATDVIVLHEHPEWQKPLFAALARRAITFEPFDVTRAAFADDEPPRASLYFIQASPSAYIRGNTCAPCPSRSPSCDRSSCGARAS